MKIVPQKHVLKIHANVEKMNANAAKIVRLKIVQKSHAIVKRPANAAKTVPLKIAKKFLVTVAKTNASAVKIVHLKNVLKTLANAKKMDQNHVVAVKKNVHQKDVLAVAEDRK